MERAVGRIGWDATVRLLTSPANGDVSTRLLHAAHLPEDATRWADAIEDALDAETLRAWLSHQEPRDGERVPDALVRRLVTLYGPGLDDFLVRARPRVRLEGTALVVALDGLPRMRGDLERAWGAATAGAEPVAAAEVADAR